MQFVLSTVCWLFVSVQAWGQTKNIPVAPPVNPPPKLEAKKPPEPPPAKVAVEPAAPAPAPAPVPALPPKPAHPPLPEMVANANTMKDINDVLMILFSPEGTKAGAEFKALTEKFAAQCQANALECRKAPWLHNACTVADWPNFEINLRKMYGALFNSTSSTAPEALNFWSEIEKCSAHMSYGQLIAALSFVDYVDGRGWSSDAVAAWLKKRRTVSDKENIMPMIRVVKSYLVGEMREKRPGPAQVRAALAEASIAWYSALPTEKINKTEAYDWLLAVTVTLGPVGKMGLAAPLLESYGVPVADSDGLLIWAMAALCEYQAFNGQIEKCEKQINLSRNASVGGKFWRQQLDLLVARNLFFRGKSSESVTQLKKVLSDLETSKESVIRPWGYLVLSAAQLSAGDLAGARETLSRQRQALGASAQETTLDRALSRLIEIELAMMEKNYPDAMKRIQSLETDLRRDVVGPVDMHYWVAFNKVAVAALSGDAATTAKNAADADKLLADLPALRPLGVLTKALVDAKSGASKPQDLEALKKKLGAGFPLVVKTDTYIQRMTTRN